MTTYTIIVFATVMLTQACCANVIFQNSIGSTVKPPANLSYEELLYVLQARHGIPQKAISLTPCARAILGCCKEKLINEQCSENHGCGAFFFDDNPCEDKFVIDALKAAKAFYNHLKDSE